MGQQPLPDFTQAGLGFAEAANEMQQQFQRMNNVPTVQLQQIGDQLTQLAHRFDQLAHRFDQRMDALEQRMDRLESKFEH